MRSIIAIGIIFISVLVFSWWGLLSLLIALPLIGWHDRHRGPFKTDDTARYTDYNKAKELANRTPKSCKIMQDILLKISKNKEHSEVISLAHSLNDSLSIEYTSQNEGDAQTLHSFVDEFSNTFPNWHKEYSIFHNIIDSNFD